MYVRVGTYPVNQIMKLICEFHKGILPIFNKLNGYKFKLSSDRYELFLEKGITCTSCGIKGRYFALERSIPKKHKKLKIEKRNRMEIYHFNLYAIDNNGKEVLMTKDHIIPKSKGGRNHISNYQTMCYECNREKSNNVCLSE